MKGFNKERMSYYNRVAVIREFYSRENIAINTLAKEMELAIPTISNIFKELEELQFIKQSKVIYTSKGRHRGLWTLNKEKEYFLALEVSPYEVKGIVVDAAGNPKSHIERKLKRYVNGDELLSSSIEVIKKLEKLSNKKIKRCAIGVHGIVNYDEGVSVFMPKILEKEEIHFCKSIEKITGYKTKIDNDCNTKALAEKWIGEASLIDNFIWLNIGYGIGAALVILGELFRGNKYTAGQIGHVSVSKDGPLCSCGNRGCIEALFGKQNILSNFKIAFENSVYSKNIDINKITMNDFYKLLEEKNEVAISIFNEYVPFLAKGVVALVNIVSPEHIFIGGELCSMGNMLLDYLKEYLNANSIYKNHDAQELSFSTLSEEKFLAGAIFLWLEEDLATKLF